MSEGMKILENTNFNEDDIEKLYEIVLQLQIDVIAMQRQIEN